jgi:hypothetical protein
MRLFLDSIDSFFEQIAKYAAASFRFINLAVVVVSVVIGNPLSACAFNNQRLDNSWVKENLPVSD